MLSFYQPTPEALSTLYRPWLASYSGGKDSTSLVTWLEWLRRSGKVVVEHPRLVLADTGVEYPFIRAVSNRLVTLLKSTGWLCEEVKPLAREKLYCQIFGRGLPPVHPGSRVFRWCTRATKVDPMKRFKNTLGEDTVMLTGVRWGESDTRDGKLKLAGCSAGGECGVNLQQYDKTGTEKLFSPIVNWRTCHVMDWLQGQVGKDVTLLMEDVFAVTKDLLDVYDVHYGPAGFGLVERSVVSLRFGCIGCPAVSRDRVMLKAIADDPTMKPLKRLYGIWEQLYKPMNRLAKEKDGRWRVGPLKMAVRKQYFPEVLDISQKTGVVLVTMEDKAFIHQCWEDRVYPRGWSEVDELVG